MWKRSSRDAVQKLSERTGAQVRRATLYDDPSKADADQIVSRLKAQLQPRTRLVVVTWVHSSTGVRLPIKEIKIDRSFVMSMETNEDYATIVRSTIELGRNLGLEGVAEGAGVSFIMLERSRTLRVPGAVYRRFTTPEPTVGIALAWPRGRELPVVARLREVADELSPDPPMIRG